MKKSFVIIFVMLFLIGCNRNTNEVLMIEDLRYENEQISWRALDHVRYYSVVISGVSYTTNEPYFNLSEYASGNYTVSVQAYMNNGDLVISEAMAFTLERTFEIPRNLSLKDGVLMWDSLVADAYTVLLNDQTYQVTEARFELPQLEEDTLFEIAVKAVYEHGESNVSRLIYTHTFSTPYKSQTVTYNRLTTTPLYVVLEVTDAVEVLLSGDRAVDYQVLEPQLIMIPHGYLKALNQVSQTFELITNKGLVELVVEFIAEENPYMVSSPNVNYVKGQNIELVFELFDGTFGGLSGQDITRNDYVMDGQLLTINYEFIETILDAQPDRSTIIIGYQLSLRDHISIGYIFIYINQ